jgi:hypothetical protein
LRELPEFKDATIVRADDIRDRYWGGRKLQFGEADFIYELTRTEIKKLLVIDRVKTVMVEMPLRESALHQEPLVEMANSAQSYLRAIDRIDGVEHTVDLRVALLYAHLPVIVDRLERRRKAENAHNANIFSLEGYLNTTDRYQEPRAYVPLSLNTTDESAAAQSRMQEAMLRFFLDGSLPTPSLGSVSEAMRVFIHARAEASRLGLV